ncbi:MULTISPECIES: ABC transporter substrate-binding protein [unclassified Frankia]|uniref:ABC transporter substrate-binding protein n=1 Tax=unclassified Frankia TaxID=2632575 RepID=UPI002023D557
MRFVRPTYALTGVTVTAALVLGACGSSDGGSSTPRAAAPSTGGSVTYAIDTEPVCYNVHVSPQDITAEVQRNVVDSLLFFDANQKIHPWLATSWETSSDFKTFTFKLRTDVTFTDGTPFDANAVKANFDHIANPKTKSQYASTLIKSYTGTEVVDPHTVKISFSAPSAPFLQAVSTPYLGFYSPKTLQENADKLCAEGPAQVGTGPFTVAEYTKGQSVRFVRNPNYRWAPEGAANTGAAYLDALTIRVLPEDSTRVGVLTSGQVDGARAVPPANVAAVEANKALGTVRLQAAGGTYQIYLNVTRAPLTDQRVRTAIQRGIDLGKDVQAVYFGQYQRAWSPLAPSTPSYDKSLENTWPFDQAVSNRLLDEAGWTGRDAEGYRTKDGKRLAVVWPLMPAEYIRDQRVVLGQAIQADLKKIGIDLQRPTFDIGTFVTKGYAGEFDILDSSWARPEPDILRLFFNSTSSAATGGQNASFISDPQLDEWTNAGAATLDTKIRDDVYGKTQKRVIELAASVPVYIPTTVVGLSKQLHGVTFDASSWPLFHGVWTEKK